MSVLDDFRRYARLIESALPDSLPFVAGREASDVVQVERGTIYPLCLQRPADPSGVDQVERLIELARSRRLTDLAVVDRSGHRRDPYAALLVYAWLQAFRLTYEFLPRGEFGRWEEGLRAWCDALEGTLTGLELPGAQLPAADAGRMTQAAWSALALFIAGKVFIRDAWTDLASDTFGRLTRAQQPDGSFFHASVSDNPETRWYHELVLLQAAASYAVQSEDRNVGAGVARSTEHHLAETQPDHATGQPWGLFAFIWNEKTRPFADELLHTAGVQQPGGADGVSFILLADALYCLRLFDRPPDS